MENSQFLECDNYCHQQPSWSVIIQTGHLLRCCKEHKMMSSVVYVAAGDDTLAPALHSNDLKIKRYWIDWAGFNVPLNTL